MKRLLMPILMFVLVLAAAAYAEGYTAPGDIYWHAIPDCMGLEHPDAAGTGAGLYPCPVCVQDEYDYPGLEVFRCAGLTVVRMADDWMAGRTDAEELWDNYTYSWNVGDAEAETAIAGVLHGDAYVEFKQALNSGKAANAIAHQISNHNDGYADKCGTFHIGGAWYDVCGPMDYPPENERDWQFGCASGGIKANGAGLEMVFDHIWYGILSEDFVDPSAFDVDAEPVWSAIVNDCEAELYGAYNFRLLKLRLTGIDALGIPALTLNCEGWPESVEVYGVKDGDDALYGAMLSEGQAMQLTNGKPLTISYETFEELTRERFGDSPYAVLEDRRYFDGCVVVDRDGNVIVPECDRIERSGNVFFSNTTGYAEGSPSDCISCSLYDADARTELLHCDYPNNTAYFAHGIFSYKSYQNIHLFRAGAAIPMSKLSDGYTSLFMAMAGNPHPTARFVIDGNAAVYTGKTTEMPGPWHSLEAHPEAIPENCLVGIFVCDADDDSDAPFALVIWSLDDSEPLTPEALGMDGLALTRVE